LWSCATGRARSCAVVRGRARLCVVMRGRARSCGSCLFCTDRHRLFIWPHCVINVHRSNEPWAVIVGPHSSLALYIHHTCVWCPQFCMHGAGLLVMLWLITLMVCE
jgi:hypothetical protein